MSSISIIVVSKLASALQSYRIVIDSLTLKNLSTEGIRLKHTSWIHKWSNVRRQKVAGEIFVEQILTKELVLF